MPARSTLACVATAVALLTGALLQAPAHAAPAPENAAPGRAPASAQADTLPVLSPADQRIQTMLDARAKDPLLGTSTTGFVTDAASGSVLWSQGGDTRQLPASTAKLVTAANVLDTYGPAYRFTTTVRRGTYWSQVVLVGAGDPSLSTAHLDALAVSTARTVRAHGVRTVTVYVDDSLFPAPTLAYGWKSTYVPGEVRPVRALVVNQHEVWDTSIDAGKVFAGRLAAHGVRVRAVYRGRVHLADPLLGSVQGWRVDSMVGTMLRWSDNDFAEAFHRLVARKAGFPATWAGAAAAQRAVLKSQGVDLGASTLYDGSGLSRADRLTAAQLVAVLTLAVDGQHPRLAALRHGSLPVAGRTGTLGPDYLRYTTWPTRCAAGMIEAKTGSVTGVVTFAGYAQGRDGRTKAFAYMVNGMPATLTTRRAVDKLATTVTGCW